MYVCLSVELQQTECTLTDDVTHLAAVRNKNILCQFSCSSLVPLQSGALLNEWRETPSGESWYYLLGPVLSLCKTSLEIFTPDQAYLVWAGLPLGKAVNVANLVNTFYVANSKTYLPQIIFKKATVVISAVVFFGSPPNIRANNVIKNMVTLYLKHLSIMHYEHT